MNGPRIVDTGNDIGFVHLLDGSGWILVTIGGPLRITGGGV